LTRDSFAGVPRLESLTARRLARLERFDKDALSALRGLTEVRTQTWPRFHLGSVLAAVASLQKLSVDVREAVLKDQLAGAFQPKMRRVELSGSSLRVAAADAFAGLDANHELTLQVGYTVTFKVAFSTFWFKFGATLRRQAERSDSEARHKAPNLT